MSRESRKISEIIIFFIGLRIILLVVESKNKEKNDAFFFQDCLDGKTIVSIFAPAFENKTTGRVRLAKETKRSLDYLHTRFF